VNSCKKSFDKIHKYTKNALGKLSIEENLTGKGVYKPLTIYCFLNAETIKGLCLKSGPGDCLESRISCT
jgi:hypothetical protein